MASFSQRAYNPPPDIASISPTYSQNSSRSNSQGYDTLVATQRGTADMAVRKKSSGVGLGGIFHRKNSVERKAAKAAPQATIQGRFRLLHEVAAIVAHP